MTSTTISHYRILRQLGKGGMGSVYLAEDTMLGRPVLMKVLSSITRDLRDRFLREARVVSALSHPSIPAVFDCGETGEGHPYIVMEFVTGESLSDKLRAGSLPLAEAVRIVLSIAGALGEAHQQELVHRDVKPSNVRITDRGQVKLIDFGVSKRPLDPLIYRSEQHHKALISPSLGNYQDSVVHIPCYLSPEQLTGQVGKSSDLFSLGVVLYHCLTGFPAFAGTNPDEISAQVLHHTPPLPSKINARVPQELDWITMKSIQKKVEDRYQSAHQIIEALRSAMPEVDRDNDIGAPKLAATVSSQSLQDFETEFDDLVLRMQKPKSKRALKFGFASSPAQQGRAAVDTPKKKQ